MTKSCKLSRYSLEVKLTLRKKKLNSCPPAKKPVLQAVSQPLHRLPDTFRLADHHETDQSTHNLTEEKYTFTTMLAIIVGHLVGMFRVVSSESQYCLHNYECTHY